MKKNLALFDFDGTITSKDTLFDIAKFSTTAFNYWIKILLMIPFFVLMKSSLLPKQKGKEIFLTLFFSGLPEKEFNSLCAKYCAERLSEIIRPKALQQIGEYRNSDTDLYIVSASPKNWIEPWANPLGIKVLSTELEIQNNKITGKILGENCNGKEKVNRIKKAIKLETYDEIFVYGDTKGDFPMLDLATKEHYKPFT